MQKKGLLMTPIKSLYILAIANKENMGMGEIGVPLPKDTTPPTPPYNCSSFNIKVPPLAELLRTLNRKVTT